MDDDDSTSKVTSEPDKAQLDNIYLADKANIDKVRWFLVFFAAVLSILGFVAFIITRDFRLLAGDSVFVIPTLFVYAYYFPRKKLE